MSAKVLMGVDEYLKTSFDGPDCESIWMGRSWSGIWESCRTRDVQ